jgi:hypothetical protein
VILKVTVKNERVLKVEFVNEPKHRAGDMSVEVYNEDGTRPYKDKTIPDKIIRQVSEALRKSRLSM